MKSGFTSGDDRAMSPVVGIILILGIVLVVILGLVVFGDTIISGDEDPRVDARFTVTAENISHIQLQYSAGADFDSDNTERLYVIGESPESDFAPGNDGEIDLYKDGGVVEHDGMATLSAGTIVIDADRANDTNIEPGTSMQIVWVPDDEQDQALIIDEVVVPDASTIFEGGEAIGNAFGGEGTIGVQGCDVREGDLCVEILNTNDPISESDTLEVDVEVTNHNTTTVDGEEVGLQNWEGTTVDTHEINNLGPGESTTFTLEWENTGGFTGEDDIRVWTISQLDPDHFDEEEVVINP